MGLDFDVKGFDVQAHWSYSGFNRFREWVAGMVGIKLDVMIGFGGNTRWPTPKKEPLVYLLNHSDCDGEISPKECGLVGPRLREILEMERFDPGDLRRSYDRDNGFALAAAMDAAVINNEPLVFC